MISLNLISPAKKKELYLLQLYSVFKNLIILVLLLSVISATVLLMTKIALQNHFATIVGQTTLNNKFANIFNNDVQTFNALVRDVTEVQALFIPWAPFLVEFSALTPSGVTFKSMSIVGNRLTISGNATTRDELLTFERQLKSSMLLTEVAIPLDHLLRKENIDFSLRATITLTTLQQML